MPAIGSDDLIEKYGSVDRVAEAWLEGTLNKQEGAAASNICTASILEAARIRIGMRINSNSPRGYIKIFDLNSKVLPLYSSKGRTNAPIPRIDEIMVLKSDYGNPAKWVVCEVHHDYYDGIYLGVEVYVTRAQ